MSDMGSAPPGGLAVYVTSHGFGHLNRAVAVINRMPAGVPVTIRSHPNLFDHWRERLRRPAALEPHVSDVGAVNPPGDSAATDGAATLELAARVHAEAMARVDDEVDWLRDAAARRPSLCDAPAGPAGRRPAGGRPGLPAGQLHLGRHLRPARPRARRRRPAARRRDPRAPTARPRRSSAPSRRCDWRASKPVIEVGMVVTPGRDRRAELSRRLGLARPTTGWSTSTSAGTARPTSAGSGWSELGERGIHFVGFHPRSGGPLANLHVVPADEWTGADLAASADAIVAKAGYGTVCEAMVAGTPMIYPPRPGSPSTASLDRACAPGAAACRPRPRDFHGLPPGARPRPGLRPRARPAAVPRRRRRRGSAERLDARRCRNSGVDVQLRAQTIGPLS